MSGWPRAHRWRYRAPDRGILFGMESAGFGLPPGYQRISADFLATTGRTLTLVDADHGGTRGFVELSVEGKPLGGFEFWWSDEADPEFAIADLAEELQEH